MIVGAFPKTPIGSLVEKVGRLVDVDPKAVYNQIGIRSHGKGLFYKPPVTGTQLGNKRVFWVEPDCFIVNIVFAWEQAIGKTTSLDVGKIASHRFPMFRPKFGKVDVDFLTYLFKTEYGKEVLGLASPGGAGRNKTLGQSEFLKIPIHLPPLPEQKRIAEILSTWDAAIGVQERLIANARTQKKALMQTLLTGKKRLPGFEGAWKYKKLSQLCSVRRGASPRPITDPRWFAESGRGWVRISDVTKSDTKFLESTLQYLSPAGVDKSVAVEPGELIMSICATIGVPKIVGVPVCIHDGFVLFRDLNPKLSLRFLFHFLKFRAADLASQGQPGTQKNLNTSIVGNILYPDISNNEQEAIAAILSSIDSEVRSIESLLETLRQEKSALMQQLLTGKRRVKFEA